MQTGLFDALPAPAVKQKSYGKQMKRAFAEERKYQSMKKESEFLQKKWKDLQPAIERRNAADRERRAELETSAPITVVLVACVSLKADEAQPAKELYRSDWFKKARKYAEENGDAWYILSALHGVLEPDEIIEPYNQTLNGKRRSERQAWAQAAASSLRSRIPPKSRIIILAGLNYRADLMPLIADRYNITAPMLGMGIGRQLAYLKNSVEK